MLPTLNAVLFFEIGVLLKEKRASDEPSSNCLRFSHPLVGLEAFSNSSLQALQRLHVVQLHLFRLQFRVQPYIWPFTSLKWLSNLLLKLVPGILSIQDIVETVQSDSIYSGICVLRIFFMLAPRCTARAYRKQNIWSMSFEVRPKKLSFLMSNSSRVVII